MRGQLGTALAVGLAVVAELVLGVLLVANGGGSASTPNPWRVGDGYPEPPPCTAVDQGPVDALVGAGRRRTQAYRLDDDDPVRVCTFGADGPDVLEITMRSRLVGPKGPLEVNALGLSELTVWDNLTRHEIKRYFDQVHVRFEIDNLDVLVNLMAHRTMPRATGDLPTPQDARRLRDGTTALARNLADKLAVRNKTGPTLPSIPPSRR